MTDTEDTTAPAPATTELRIALVCYGGVSLAVYMHGVTKELYKLVRAARAFDADRDGGAAPGAAAHFPASAGDDVEFDTEAWYYEALATLAAQGHPISPTIDVIAGTSAGGINGVFLARALAHGASLNGLRSLWINDGDLEGLLNGHPLVPGPHLAKMVSKIAVALGRMVDKDNRHDAPLNGALMSQLLHGALRDMPPVTPSLVLPEGSLDLFTTATDVYGYSTAIPSGAGGISHTDRSFRQVLSFHYEQRSHAVAADAMSDDFGDEWVPALAFAARATSSFPGAFPSVSLGTFAAAVNEHTRDAVTDLDAIASRFVYRGEYQTDPAHAWYMDGGVLDNGPFDHVIDAIAGKRASGPIERELIYIEPDPGAGPGPEALHDAPTWLKVIATARTTIPWHTSLVDTLDQLRDMNATIGEVGAVADGQMDAVLGEMDGLSLGIGTGYAAMIDKGPDIRKRAKELAGLTYGGYCKLRAEAVAAQIADTLATRLGYPPQSNRRSFVDRVVTAWLRSRQQWMAIDPAALETALGALDVPLRLRRAQFLLQGLNDLFDQHRAGDPTMLEQLRTMKAACWDLIEHLNAVVDAATGTPEVFEQAKAVLGKEILTDAVAVSDPAEFAIANNDGLNQLFDRYRANLQSEGSSKSLWDLFEANTQGWDADSARQFASRYLLFPIWDAIIFPIIAMAKLPALSPIRVRRFSPLDATSLDPADTPDFGSHKLRGTAIDHFGGFFAEAWRENDYLWGRLDGVELILQLLSEKAGGICLDAVRAKAFRAVLTAESGALGDIRDDLAAIAGRIRG